MGAAPITTPRLSQARAIGPIEHAELTSSLRGSVKKKKNIGHIIFSLGNGTACTRKRLEVCVGALIKFIPADGSRAAVRRVNGVSGN